jgi:chitin disaccharide deacetylase
MMSTILGLRQAMPGANEADPIKTGLLIVNADDWGRDVETTDRTAECILQGALSSVSAMVFMEDSERAAGIAQDRDIDTGLHINLTEPFSAPSCPARLRELQRELAHYLRRHRFARTVFQPRLAGSFAYVITAQIDEFRRLYGKEPRRLDGHHHMHLCANVLLSGLLPRGTVVRRNQCWFPGEKSLLNRLYRSALDRILVRRHHVVDYVFQLPPFVPAARLARIFSLGRLFSVELETHAVRAEEYRFLATGEIFRWTRDVPIAACFGIPPNDSASY